MLLNTMRPLAVVAAIVIGWSLNAKWGTGTGLVAGPPAQLEKLIVGTLLLTMIAALALFWVRRPKARVVLGSVIIAAVAGAAWLL